MLNFLIILANGRWDLTRRLKGYGKPLRISQHLLSYLKMNWNVLGKCSLLSTRSSKKSVRYLAKLLGAIFIFYCDASNTYYSSCTRLIMARLMQILTIRFLSTEHGMGCVHFHGTAHVDWTRNGSCRFSRYGSCRLTTD
jgi:hypothetical protein